MNLIKTLEQEEIKRLKRDIPDFAPGDTVIVNVNVVEGERKRLQAFDDRNLFGLQIIIHHSSIITNHHFIVRRSRPS